MSSEIFGRLWKEKLWAPFLPKTFFITWVGDFKIYKNTTIQFLSSTVAFTTPYSIQKYVNFPVLQLCSPVSK